MSVDEEISIAAIERELHEQQERLRAARLRLKKKQQQDAHDRAASLKTRLDELDATVDNERGDRMELRATLLRLREAESVDSEQHLKMQKQVWELERGHQLEEVARLRLSMEDMRDKRELLEGILANRAIQLEVIEKERQRRGCDNEQILQKLLEKADAMREEINNGAYDATTRARFATIMLEAADDDTAEGAGIADDWTSGTFRLADEVAAVRRKRRATEKREREEHLRRLNQVRIHPLPLPLLARPPTLILRLI